MNVGSEMKPDSLSLDPLGAAPTLEPNLMCIFGTGDLGRSLGLRLLQCGYSVVYGSRRPQNCGPLPQGAQVKHMATPTLGVCPNVVRDMTILLMFMCLHGF